MRIVYPLSTYINLVETKPINRQLAPVVQTVDKAIILLVSLTLIPWIVIYQVDCAIRVHTKNCNHFSRTFQGLFKDHVRFSRTTY